MKKTYTSPRAYSVFSIIRIYNNVRRASLP
jgi:hypothetical protein